MSYGLNVEMHKQTEIGKRLDAILRQVLPFLSGEVSSGSKARPRPFSRFANSKNVFPFAAPTASRDGRGESQANHHGRTERGNAGKAEKCIYLFLVLAFETSIRSSLSAIDS